MVLTLGTMAVVFSTATITDAGPVLGDTAGPIALVAANLYVVFFGVSWGPVMWVLLGEMFNNRIRSTALGLAAAAQWLANFAVSTAFPPMAEFSLPFTYGFYAVAALLSLPEGDVGVSFKTSEGLAPLHVQTRATVLLARVDAAPGVGGE